MNELFESMNVMILSVSRRTDIPAFYGDWFLNRLRESFAMVRNPFNPNQVRRIEIHPDAVDGFVFWSKHPRNFFPVLDKLIDYPFYFQYTITPYSERIERYAPPLEERLKTFCELSRRTGADRMIWRYDPIFFPEGLDAGMHLISFEKIASALSGYTHHCTISFIQLYKKCLRNLSVINYAVIRPGEKIDVAGKLSRIAAKYGMAVTACAEETDLSPAGVGRGRCVDAELLSRISGKQRMHKKDKSQRPACGCSESADIGAYNTCRHLCLYCYANTNTAAVTRACSDYDPASPFLCEKNL